jgi:hypothetical protein
MKKLCLCLALASLLGLGGQAFAVIGTIDNVPAATLLLPYFEVDITHPDGVNTFFSVNNASATAVLAHVTVWSDQSIPVLDFDVYLTGYDVQTVSMLDILRDGILPRTASAGQDPSPGLISPKGPFSQDINFASCNGTLPYTVPALNAAFRAHLQAALQGNPSPTFGTCYGSKKNDGILRGYVTVDTVNSCSVLFPSQMLTGYRSVMTDQNVLWGDYFYVNGAQNFANGDPMVAIEAAPAGFFTPGQHTFYGRYTANPPGTPPATLIDNREPLPTTMGARYLGTGSIFNGGTHFVIWREGGDQTSTTGYNCNLDGPVQWYPLSTREVLVFDETEQVVTPETCPSGFDCNVDIVIPNESQRLDVITDLLSPFPFGWVYINGQTNGSPPMAVLPAYGDPFAQMWLETVMDANGRFSVGFSGVQFDNANRPAGTIP